MSGTTVVNGASSESDRLTAAICHGLSIPMPWLGPAGFCIYGFLARRRFVAAHASAALIESILATLGTIVVVLISLGVGLAIWIPQVMESGWEAVTWEAALGTVFRAAAVWLLLAVVGLIYTIQSIRQAVAAYRGELPKGGWVNRIALRWSQSIPVAPANEQPEPRIPQS